MTVIAWDGHELVGDCLLNLGGTKIKSRKVFKITNKRGTFLFGTSGDTSASQAMRVWVENGMLDDDFPSFTADWECSALLITEALDILLFEGSIHPTKIEQRFIAIGCGRGEAMGVMHVGHPARTAVEVAAIYDANCGLGYDAVSFDD